MKTNQFAIATCVLFALSFIALSVWGQDDSGRGASWQQRQSRDLEIFKRGYILPRDSVQVVPDYSYSPGSSSSSPVLHSIEIRKEDTKVTFRQPIYFDSQWIYYSPGFTIIDKKSGDEYRVRRYDGCSSMDRVQIVQGFKNKYIYVSLIFPKLKKKVKVIDIVERPHAQDELTLPSNNDGLKFAHRGIWLKNYLINSKKGRKVYY